MMSPTTALFPGPGKVSDPEYVCFRPGGIHLNGGVMNHAYALMVDGGSYNRFAIRGIGIGKAVKIEYRAMTVYLMFTSSVRDNYDALLQSCDDLVGIDGITETDCGEVKKALDAVEMDFAWGCLCGNDRFEITEECEDGNTIDGDGCDSNCKPTGCGNGIVTSPEQCDRGSCCTPTCELMPVGTRCADDGPDRAPLRCGGRVPADRAPHADHRRRRPARRRLRP